MRRLPKFIRIASLKIGVGIVPNLTFGEHEHDVRAYGVFEQGKLIIFLDKDSGPERTKVTLVHEVVHALIDVAHVEMDEENEEVLVGRIAPLVLDFLRTNKATVAYLQES